MAIVIVNDATHANISSLPKGQLAAGYTTGSGTVPWTAADWAAHPGAVRIDQSPDGHDPTADVYDVETNAGTIKRAPGWAKDAMSNYRTGNRPGQRSPAIYLNLFNVTPVVNALIGAGVTSGIGLWLADWNNREAADAAQVLAGSGPFPVIAIQFRNAGLYDGSVFSSTWLTATSGKNAPVPAGHYIVSSSPPGIWHTGMSGTYSGTGTDGQPWETSYDDGKGWTTPVRQ